MTKDIQRDLDRQADALAQKALVSWAVFTAVLVVLVAGYVA